MIIVKLRPFRPVRVVRLAVVSLAFTGLAATALFPSRERRPSFGPEARFAQATITAAAPGGTDESLAEQADAVDLADALLLQITTTVATASWRLSPGVGRNEPSQASARAPPPLAPAFA